MNKTRLSALAIALALAVPPLPAAAQESDPSKTIERGAQLVIEGLRAFFSSIPQYEMPEMLPNGDIIIRRVPPGQQKREEKKGDKAPESLKL